MLQFKDLCVERPLGSEGNAAVLALLEKEVPSGKYAILDLPLQCSLWRSGPSYIEQDGKVFSIFSSPFSQKLSGQFSIKIVSDLQKLKEIQDFHGILIFKDELTREALMPIDFPFYFPDEHKELYEIIDRIRPAGIITLTGKDPASGLDPFPVFGDPHFMTPSAYTRSLEGLDPAAPVSVLIDSEVTQAASKQPVFRKEGRKKDITLIAAHIDSKYGTAGALDNGAGVYTLYKLLEALKDLTFENTLELVPFNGEESPEASGELAYLQYIEEKGYTVASCLNIDGPGHRGSQNMFAFFNYDSSKKADLIRRHRLLEGAPWYGGDHTIFAFQEIPCIAVTSSDMFTAAMNITHTPADTPDGVDVTLLDEFQLQ